MIAKQRLRETITTVIGVLFFIGALAMVFMNVFYEKDFAAWSTIIPISLLGWVFLWSKNSLLEGITLGLFKVRNQDEY